MSNKKSYFSLIILIIVTIILTILSIFIGVYDIFKNENGIHIILTTRIPRTIAILLSGIAISLSGYVMQLITRNKMVEPTTTGTLDWAGLGLLFVYVLIPSPSIVLRMSGAILFSFIGTILFLMFLNKVKLRSSFIVPIVGMMCGAIISSLSIFLSLLFNQNQVIHNWFVGSFSGIQSGRYEFLWLIIVVVIILIIYANHITIISLGSSISKNLGVDYQKIVFIGSGLVSISIGIVASVIGNIPFLGLIVPNIISLYFGDDMRFNLLWICFTGMIVLLITDLISRTLIMPFEIPVSLVLGIFGTIMFTILLIRRNRLYGK